MPPRLGIASEQQKRLRDLDCHEAWGARLTPEQFGWREERLRAHHWAQRTMTTWLFRDGLGDVLSSCETFRMQSSFRGEVGHSYGVASVYTSPALRGAGHASAMMQMLVERVHQDDPTAHAMHLYSDVGPALYERSGFVARPALDWVLSPCSGQPEHLVDQMLDEAHFTVPPPPQSEDFVIWPDAAQIDWHLERERLYATLLGRPRPRYCGARAGASSVLWAGDLKDGKLFVLLLSAEDKGTAGVLIEAARRTAHKAGLSEVVIWENPTLSKFFPSDIARRAPRDGSLPMLRPLTSALAPELWRTSSRAIWV